MRVIPLGVLVLLLAPLAACGSDSPLGEVFPNLASNLFAQREPDRLAIAEAESGDVAQEGTEFIRFALGRRSADATLIQQQGRRRMWRAAGGVVVATDGARVVATSGLPQMVMGTRIDGTDPLEDPRALVGRSAETRRLVDISGAARTPASMRFGIAFDCRLRAANTDEGLILIEERCRVTGAPPVTNRFWADGETGAISYAEQWVGPGLGRLALDFTPGD